jgi:hypothetical protein
VRQSPGIDSSIGPGHIAFVAGPLSVNPILLLVIAVAGSLLRAGLGLWKQARPTITSDVTRVPLGEQAAAGHEIQVSILGVNSGPRSIDVLTLTVRHGRDSEMLLPVAVLQPATTGPGPRITPVEKGLECTVVGLGPGQGLSLCFVLKSRWETEVDVEWSSPSGRVAIVDTRPAARSTQGRVLRLVAVAGAGYAAVVFGSRLAGFLAEGNTTRVIAAACYAIAAGLFAWAGFGLYDVIGEALRPGRHGGS